MFTSQFDGIMPSQATQTANPSFSFSKSRESQQLLPLTVKQINEAFLSSDEKSNFLIDGVKLVGMVLNKAERITDVSFLIDDGSGRIDCNIWVNEDVDTKEMEGIMDGMYVCVHGHLKGFQGKKKLVVFSIRIFLMLHPICKPVTDYNEITYHFVECTCVHYYNTRLRKLQGGAPTVGHIPNSAASTLFEGIPTCTIKSSETVNIVN